MDNMPRLRIELEGIRQTVNHMFMDNQGAMADMIAESLERTMKAEWVQEKINFAVQECINKAINDVADNWNLKSAITDMIAKNIEQLIKQGT